MMKYIYLLFTLAITTVTFSQTTEKEYNYYSEYYAEDLKTGRDLISGYNIESVDRFISRVSFKNSKYSDAEIALRDIEIFTVTRIEENYKCGILVKLSRRDTGFLRYIFIPSEESEKDMLKKAENEFYKNTSSLSEDNTMAFHYLWNALNIIKNTYLK